LFDYIQDEPHAPSSPAEWQDDGCIDTETKTDTDRGRETDSPVSIYICRQSKTSSQRIATEKGKEDDEDWRRKPSMGSIRFCCPMPSWKIAR